ncbi:MAG: Wzz/FepE/Etk N-terminal domain-containing protein, partial [Pseudomonadales bacterium]
MAEREEWVQDNEIDLIELFKIFWADKFLIVFITAIGSGLGVAYALLATEWYKAEVTLAPTVADPMSGISAQLGGLASLAGIGGIGSSGDDRSIEAIATLNSRELAREFIEDHGLTQRIF